MGDLWNKIFEKVKFWQTFLFHPIVIVEKLKEYYLNSKLLSRYFIKQHQGDIQQFVHKLKWNSTITGTIHDE